MTALRTAAQQALDALEGGADSWQLVGPAITALKAALAEPVQEPVAWSHINGTSDTKWHPPQRPAEPVQEPVFEVGFGWLDDATKYPKGTKLYTSPPQRKPLTETSAERTLKRLGYTDCGGEFWKPPLGAPAEPVQEPEPGEYHGWVLREVLFDSGEPVGHREPVQDPVAWRTFDGEGGYDYRTYEDNEDYAAEWAKRNPRHVGWVEPLYTAPKRKPLTDEEIYSLFRTVASPVMFARAIERAHGIGGQP